jgi:photosystem II stability/assembly factor-like uncharacterized protein
MRKRTLVAIMALAVGGSAGGGGAAATVFHVRGLGGGGGMYVPSVSPYDSGLMFLACDMGGTYRSEDGGRTWELIHFREMSGNHDSAFPAYFPAKVFWNRGADLRASADRGRTWRSVAADPPWGGQAITRLAAVPGTPDVLLVGTAGGLWRSEDDGRSFSLVIPDATRDVAEAGGKLFTFSGRNTLQVSADRGRTWTPSHPETFGENSVFGFTGAADDAGGVLFASVWNVGIARSRDEGLTWQVVLEPYNDQRLLQMAAGQTKVVYAAQNGGGWCRVVQVSADGGDTWTSCFRMSGPDSNVELSWVQSRLKWGYYISANGFAAGRSDPRLALLTTQGDFYITRDGGGSWRQHVNEVVGVQPGDPGVRYRSTGLEVTSCWGYYFDPFDKSREYIAFTDIGFGRSVDNGRTWIWSAEGSPWQNTFYAIAFDPATPRRIYAACSNRHDIPHWTHVSPNDPASPSHTGGVCLSTDGAVSWQPLGNGLPPKPCTDVCLDPDSPPESRTLYAAVFGEGVFKSTDGGGTWIARKNGLGNPGNLHAYRLRRHPRSGNLYCLITACREGNDFRVPGGIWKSTDGGGSWTDITAGPALVWPTALWIDPADENRVFLAAATAPGKPQGGIYLTRDGGGTWRHVLKDADVALSGGPGYDHFMAVAVSPADPGLVYAGTTSHGLWFSRDGGGKWEQYAAFPFPNVQSISFHPDDPGRLYLTTFGAGAWVGPCLPPAANGPGAAVLMR